MLAVCRVLVLDCRGVDQNFHDVTIVDMGDMPESPGSIPDSKSTMAHSGPERTGGDAIGS